MEIRRDKEMKIIIEDFLDNFRLDEEIGISVQGVASGDTFQAIFNSTKDTCRRITFDFERKFFLFSWDLEGKGELINIKIRSFDIFIFSSIGIKMQKLCFDLYLEYLRKRNQKETELAEKTTQSWLKLGEPNDKERDS